MPRFSSPSLRVRLLLLVSLAIIPALGLILYTAAEERSLAMQEAEADALRVARQAANNHALLIEQARQVLVRLTEVPNVRRAAQLPCSAIFNDLQTQYLQQYPRYTNLGTIDLAGNIQCSVLPVSGPSNVGAEAEFQRAVQTLAFTGGHYEIDRAIGKTILTVMYPVVDFAGTHAQSVLFATLDLGWLNELATQAGLPEGATFTVVDQDGTILIRQPESVRWVGRALPETTVLAAMRARAEGGALEAIDADGVRRLYAFMPLRGSVETAYVSIGIAAEIVFAQADRLLTRNVIALSVVAVLALAAAWIGSDVFVLRQVNALVAATRRLRAGDLSARTGLPEGADELNQLARAFDRMAETLQQRAAERQRAETALRTSEELYRTLVRNFPNGAVILFDKDLRYTIADGTGLAAVGLSREAMEGKTIWEIFPPETAAALEPMYRAALAGTSTTAEIPYADLIYEIRVLPVTNDTGEIVAGMAMTQDVTQQRKAEAQLRASEAELRALFAAMTDVILVLDAQGRFLKIAPTNPSLLYRPDDELIGKTLRETFPAALADELQSQIDTARRTGQTLQTEYSLCIREREVWFAASLSPMPDHTVLLVARDITARRQAEAALRESEEQYRSIFESVSDGLFINDLETGLMVDFNPAAARMHGYTLEEFRRLQPQDFIHPDSHHLFAEYMETVRAGREFRSQAVDVRRDGTPFHVEVFGTSFLYRGKPHTLGVVRDITERIQAQQLLEQRVQERTRELATLLDISRNVASTLELRPLLGLILDQLKPMVDYQGATLLTLHGNRFIVLDYRGPLGREQMHLPAEWWTLNRDRIYQGQIVMVDDVRGETPLARAFQHWAGDRLETALGHIRSLLGIPLMIKERVIGMMSLTCNLPGCYTEQHVKLVTAIASQAAIAIENARLYEQARQLAALEERQKLARELHDSVSQALYGIALGARTARTLLDRNPTQSAEPLDYVLSLAEAGLAEMRALIFELRPESLETEGLVAALTKQADSLRARHRIEVITALAAEPDLSLEGKEALYRIAQEALHNVVKHARASQVALRLALTNGSVELELADDGVGFDADADFPGHLGLRSMRERAERLGGSFEVETAPDRGTRIRVRIPAGQNA